MSADNPPSDKLLGVVGVFLMAVATLCGLGAIWWWALRGMTGPVGIAITVTVATVDTVGFFFVMIGTAPGQPSRGR
jgi:hypothetical protein